MSRRISVGTWAILGFNDHLVAGPRYGRKEAVREALEIIYESDKIRARRDRDKAWKNAKRQYGWRIVRVVRFEIEEIGRG